jgi:carboxyl-terminal processing protease
LGGLLGYLETRGSRAYLFLVSSFIDVLGAASLGYVFSVALLGLGDSIIHFAVGLVFASIPVISRVARIRLEISGEELRAAKIRKRHLLISTFIFLSVAIIVGREMYLLSSFPFLSINRVSSFERLVNAIEAMYPYFQLKGISWDEIALRYRTQVLGAKTDEEFMNLISQMLAELNDGHTGSLTFLPIDIQWFGLVKYVSGQAVVSYLRPSVEESPEWPKGFSRGSIILSRDGLNPYEFCETLPETWVSASTAQSSIEKGFGYLLAIPRDTSVTYTYKTVEGHIEEAQFTWDDKYLLSQSSEKPSVPVRGKILPSGVGYIVIDHLSEKDIVEEFDSLLNSMMETQGVILDLRNNGGGSSVLGDKIVGRFMDRRFVYGTEYYRTRTYHKAWARKMDYSVKPRPPIYKGTLVVLTDTDTFSSAELMVASLKDSGRAITVGRNTGGGSGNPITFHVPGGTVRFSTGDMIRANGLRIEGMGFSPDIEVKLSPQDIAEEIDRDIIAAEEFILSNSR